MHLVYPPPPPPPQILQNHCLGFLLRRLLHSEEIGNHGYANFGVGVDKVRYGLCESSEFYDPNIAALSRGCKNKPRTHHSPVFQFDWNRSYRCLSVCYRAFSVTWPAFMPNKLQEKEIVSIRKDFNSHGIGLGHQHGRRSVSMFWNINIATVTSSGNAL